MPERRRAIRSPRSRPEVTIEREAARLFGGARSPTKGSMSCGVTVVTAEMNEMAVKTAKLSVMQTPILEVRVSIEPTPQLV